MSRHWLGITAALSLLAHAGCSAASGGADQDLPRHLRAGGVSLTETSAHAASVAEPLSLCASLASVEGGAGLYEVESLTSFVEEQTLSDGRSFTKAFTYAQLRTLEPWTRDAPVDPVVRMRGGTYPDGAREPCTASLRSGEHVGVLLLGRSEFNHGYYAVSQDGVFHVRSHEALPSPVLANSYETLGTPDVARERVGRLYGLDEEDCEEADQ